MGRDRTADRLKGKRLRDDAEPSHDAVRTLLDSAGLRGRFTLTPLQGGANNRVWRVDCDRRAAALKRYFRHPTDRRDRLLAEFSFLTVAWEAGVRVVPRPLGTYTPAALGLYDFLDGRRPGRQDVTAAAVGQCLDFYVALNAHKGSAPARWLPLASEACARVSDHVACVDSRIRRLAALEMSTSVDRDAAGFVRTELSPAWNDVQRALAARLQQYGLSAETEVMREDWALSPSDFGFHNALISADGRLRFLDFEYAGWDDPARVVCDFFCQQRVPVPFDLFEAVVERIGATVIDRVAYRQRVDLLLPVYRVKWCCILLNDFLPEGGERRRFAGRKSDPVQRKVEQLEKARRVMAGVVA
jgi:hypothetical protein